MYGPCAGGKLGEVRRVIALSLCMLWACFDPKLAFENANNCGVSQNFGTCSGTQSFCCLDILNRCTTQTGCQL